MGKRAKQWAREKRAWLLDQLGRKCVHCGETEVSELTVDHIHGKDWSARGKSTDQRMGRYLKEFREPPLWCSTCERVHGLLQILCNRCNSRKGDPDQDERDAINFPQDDYQTASNEPF